jgi:hypothetical protein
VAEAEESQEHLPVSTGAAEVSSPGATAPGATAPGATALAPTEQRRVWLWALLAAGVISIPSLFGDFSSDDLLHRLALEGRLPDYPLGPFSLYDFTPRGLNAEVLIERGMFPWFTSPELSLRFMRPISSASLALDHVLFGRNALLAHVQSWLWMLLLAGAAARLYQRWFTPGAALLSALVFAVSTVHGTPTAWLASRHTLIAAALAVLALWAWVRYREDRQRLLGPLALLALGSALLASESGLVGVVLIASYELVSRGLRRGLVGALPVLLLGLGYVAVYVSLGYGAHGSSFYVSPFSTPFVYLGLSLWSVPSLCAELLLGAPSALASFFPETRAAIVLAGLAASAALGALLYAVRALLPISSRRTLLWLAAGTWLGLFALIGAPVTGRVLPLPAFGAAALIGNALWASRRLLRESRQRGPSARRGAVLGWGALISLALLHFGVSPLLRVGIVFQYRQMAQSQRLLAEQADVGACAQGGSLYLLTGADPMLALYTAPALRFYTPDKAGAERLRVLSMAPQAQWLSRPEAQWLSRPEAQTLRLEVADTPRQSNAFEHLYRPADDPLVSGARVQLPELLVHVEEAEGGIFKRVRFELEGDVQSPPACLLAWKGGRLVTLPLPKPGERVSIAHEPGPMGM